mmetsp:Transcript_15119/g.57023  ORF Transcript_15119/g.57023 Transcript_15119/m.57023 type:complete len:262 (+) Transcript_15119:868-1653(+)
MRCNSATPARWPTRPPRLPTPRTLPSRLPAPSFQTTSTTSSAACARLTRASSAQATSSPWLKCLPAASPWTSSGPSSSASSASQPTSSPPSPTTAARSSSMPASPSLKWSSAMWAWAVLSACCGSSAACPSTPRDSLTLCWSSRLTTAPQWLGLTTPSWPPVQERTSCLPSRRDFSPSARASAGRSTARLPRFPRPSTRASRPQSSSRTCAGSASSSPASATRSSPCTTRTSVWNWSRPSRRSTSARLLCSTLRFRWRPSP